MHLNPYGEYAVLLAGSLANDWPADRAALFERTREFGMTLAWPEEEDDHPRTRAVIDGWLEVVDTPSDAVRAEALNERMARAAAYPRMTDHDGQGWHLHYRAPDRSMPDALASVIAVGTALHLVTRGMHRLGRCAADPCTRVVVDVTRNGRQRYCSTRCANRAAVRRHRARIRNE
ncbi:CGNR zinc finger domain-containing protein [Microbacterium indicum]|uniref:CGNR zinc finger domain-containing protein n=1 Tax=Microbacterium indicum TaxID=358100 RepID=UPI00040F792F|nr:CGNR zinc finger domain-containing protein [Microbacterium indicum]